MSEGTMSGILHAGFAEIDISPPPGTQIAGDIGRRRPTEEIRAPIYARAAVFAQGDTRLCVLVLDVLCVTDEWVARIRDGAAERFGFCRDAVMVHATQSHSAPSIGNHFFRSDNPAIPPEHDWLCGGAPEYSPVAVERSLEAVGAAAAGLEPVALYATRGIESRVAFNRRFITRDGDTSTHAACGRENVVCVEGPIDPEVGLLQFRAADGRPAGMFLHFTSHPTFGYPKRYISPDWPGHWVDRMKAFTAGQAMALVINGCCGNVYPHDRLGQSGPESDQDMARVLAETSCRLAERLAPVASSPLRFASRHIDLPLRELDPEMLAEARAMLERHPTPKWRTDAPEAVEWDWMYAVGRLELERMRNKSPTFAYEIQAFRIGDVALLALVGEPFVEGQLNIKLRSPAAFTFVAHMSNGFAGYIPTGHGLRGGGYESRTSMGSRFAGEALGSIVEASVELLAELFERPARRPVMELPV